MDVLVNNGHANLSSCLYTVSINAVNLRRFKNCKWPERSKRVTGRLRKSLRANLTAVAIDADGAATKAEG